MRSQCFICRSYDGDRHVESMHREWEQLRRRDEALARLRDVMDEQTGWPSNRSLRESLYEAIALLSDESR